MSLLPEGSMYMVPSKLLHIFSQLIMLLEMTFKDLYLTKLIFYLLAFACKGRIKKLDKACVDFTAFRASVRAAMKVVTHPTSLKEPNTQVMMWGYHQLSSMATA